MSSVVAANCLHAQSSGWRFRSLQSKLTRHERAVAKGFYKPMLLSDVSKPLSAQETKGEWNADRSAKAWANFRDGDAGMVSKRWMDSDAESPDGQDAVDVVPN